MASGQTTEAAVRLLPQQRKVVNLVRPVECQFDQRLGLAERAAVGIDSHVLLFFPFHQHKRLHWPEGVQLRRQVLNAVGKQRGAKFRA